MMTRSFLLASLLCTTPWLSAQAVATPPAAAETRTGFLDETIAVAGTEHRYVLYVPPGYAKERAWPLIVFLNGAGECGTDGLKQTSVGLAPAIKGNPAAWPFLVLFPQKPDRPSAWEDHDATVLAMLDKTKKDYAVDGKQLFLTGLSQGGHGTWVLGARHADMWAAIAPICGYGQPAAIAPALKAMPVWCFHGEDDKAVPVKQSKELCAAVEKAGGHTELTLYPGTGHNSWDKAYREAPLAEWLMVVANDRVRAAYVARPECATRATITVRHTSSKGGDPASLDTRTVTLEFDDKKLAWRIAVERGAEQPVELSQGTLELREGQKELLQQLRALQNAAVFQLKDPIVPAPVRGVIQATNEFAVDVSLDGTPGPWRFHCDVPKLAEFDSQFAPQVRALVEFVRAVERQR